MVRKHHSHPHFPQGDEAQAFVKACQEFLRSIGQAAKLITLYKASHPVPTAALQTSWTALKGVFAMASNTELTLALSEGRWSVQNIPIFPETQGPELLSQAFRFHGLFALTFSEMIKAHELAALGELCASAASGQKISGNISDYFKMRGVRGIRGDVSPYTSVLKTTPAAPAAPNPVESPLAASRRQQAPNADGSGPAAQSWHERLTGLPMGSFIKTLVEGSVSDPAERAKIYSEALSSVQKALERRVSEATVKLQNENIRALSENARTESVVSSMAQGKVVVDKDGRVLMMDSVAEKIAGKKLSELAGKSIHEHAKPDQHVLAMATDIRGAGDGPVSDEVKILGDEELLESFQQSIALIQDEQGRVIGTYGVMPYVDKFREALRVKEKFVSHVTHELKAPLSAICAALELLSTQAAGKLGAQESRFIEISLKNAETLRQMIGEVLDFSKLRTGKTAIHPELCAAEPILREAVENMQPWAVSKGISLSLAIDLFEKTPLIWADHAATVQVLTNLISNAIKSTESGGRIIASASPGQGEHAGRIVFSVNDTGCGIPKEDQAKIFEEFTQANNVRGGKREGVGLGLAIVKEILKYQKAGFWLESEPGAGSTFYFSMPQRPE